MADDLLLQTLSRIADALDRLAPPVCGLDLSGADAFVWRPSAGRAVPVSTARVVRLGLLKGVDAQRDALLANTVRFAEGAPANNALLWGARGTGKSALIKAVHAEVAARGAPLKLIEAPAIALAEAPTLIDLLSEGPWPTIVFLDDLSLETDDAALRALKTALDGSLSAASGRVIVYATSNRRHAVAPSDASNASPHDPALLDAEQDRLALSDRFGLWLGFHAMDQATFLQIVSAYVDSMGIEVEDSILQEALVWSRSRAARSGRTAWQFVLDLAARRGASPPF